MTSLDVTRSKCDVYPESLLPQLVVSNGSARLKITMAKKKLRKKSLKYSQFQSNKLMKILQYQMMKKK